MTKLVLADIASIDTAIATINANNALIEAAMDKAVFTSGEIPNDMEADFDMNGNAILNAANIDFTSTHVYEDEGTPTGTPGSVAVVDFVGSGVVATQAAAELTVTINQPTTFVDVQTFLTPGTDTWTKPAGAKLVQVRLVSGGSAGGGGRQFTSGGASGGGGGMGGNIGYREFYGPDLPATVQIEVGAGGIGGAAGLEGNGGDGGDGGYSRFGITSATNLNIAGDVPGQILIGADRTDGAKGGTDLLGIAATGNEGGSNDFGKPTTTGLSPGVGNDGGGSSAFGPPLGDIRCLSGGGGGGVASGGTNGNGGNASDMAYAGVTGINANMYNYIHGQNTGGDAGTAIADGTQGKEGYGWGGTSMGVGTGGGGGGGGYGVTPNNAGRGGHGGQPGGGGGGGGGARTPGLAGAGGNGGNGSVVITTWI